MSDDDLTLGEPVHMRLLRSELRSLERLLDERDVRYQQRFEGQQQVIRDAQLSIDKRFAGVNEFRAALSDQTATFMPRAEADARMSAISDRIDINRHQIDVANGQDQGLATGWRFLVGAVTVAGALIAMSISIFAH